MVLPNANLAHRFPEGILRLDENLFPIAGGYSPLRRYYNRRETICQGKCSSHPLWGKRALRCSAHRLGSIFLIARARSGSPQGMLPQTEGLRSFGDGGWRSFGRVRQASQRRKAGDSTRETDDITDRLGSDDPRLPNGREFDASDRSAVARRDEYSYQTIQCACRG